MVGVGVCGVRCVVRVCGVVVWCGVGLFHRAPASAFSSSDPAPCSLSRSPSLFLSARSIFHHPTAVSTRARTITAPLRPPPPISHYMICFACSVSTRFYSFIPRITLSGPFAFVPSPFSIHHHSLTPSLVLCTAAIDGRCLASPFPRFARIGAVHAAAPCPPSPRTYHRIMFFRAVIAHHASARIFSFILSHHLSTGRRCIITFPPFACCAVM